MDKLIQRARKARRDGRLDAAKKLYGEALLGASSLSERAVALTGVGQIERDQGNVCAARQLYLEAAALYRLSGDPLRLAHTVRHVADMDREAGNFASAEPAYRESLALYRKAPEPEALDVANMLNGFASLLAASGNAREEAIAFTQEACEIYSRLELKPGVSECTARLKALEASL